MSLLLLFNGTGPIIRVSTIAVTLAPATPRTIGRVLVDAVSVASVQSRLLARTLLDDVLAAASSFWDRTRSPVAKGTSVISGMAGGTLTILGRLTGTTLSGQARPAGPAGRKTSATTPGQSSGTNIGGSAGGKFTG